MKVIIFIIAIAVIAIVSKYTRAWVYRNIK